MAKIISPTQPPQLLDLRFKEPYEKDSVFSYFSIGAMPKEPIQLVDKGEDPEPSDHKQIFTPIWYTNDEYERLNRVSYEQHLKKITEVHFRLEVIENRINNGTDEKFVYSGNAPDIEKYKNPLNMNSKERRLGETYEIIQECNTVPTFWPKRSYDSQNKILTEEESDTLKDIIIGLDKTVEITNPSLDMKRKKKQPSSNLRHTVKFSLLDYETEQEDDNTDWTLDDF